MELKLRIRQEKDRLLRDNPHPHQRTRSPSSELDTRYIGFEYSCDLIVSCQTNNKLYTKLIQTWNPCC